MKKTLLLLGLLTSSLVTSAQISLTKESVPSIGTTQKTYLLTKPDTENDEGEAGGNQIYDFSKHSSEEAVTGNYLSPEDSPYASDYPEANLLAKEGNTNVFYEVTDDYCAIWGSIMGEGEEQIQATYSKKQEYMRFPLNYQDEQTGTFSGINEYEYTQYREGVNTVMMDGFGTFIHPNGTTEEVVRVRLSQVFDDSTYFGDNMYALSHTELISYLFYSSADQSQLLSVTYTTIELQSFWGNMELSSESIPTQKTISYVGNHASSVDDSGDENDNDNAVSVIKPEEAFTTSIAPNPFTSETKVLINAKQKSDVKLRIVSQTGQLIDEIFSGTLYRGKNEIDLYRKNLQSGLYYLLIEFDGKQMITKKLIVQ